jgi:hypothetical protein
MANDYSLTHVDTCLSCYVQDHCNGDNELLLGVPVDRSTRAYQLRAALADELQVMGDSRDSLDYDKAEAAIREWFKDVHPLKAFDNRLETASPEDDCELCYAWFRLEWEPAEEDETA